ncbi:MAG: hypothetical protein IPG84_12305 [Betaproteobacteria bacterium]|nr:hypothetical protein [Betaproteobacteria bacterium]
MPILHGEARAATPRGSADLVTDTVRAGVPRLLQGAMESLLRCATSSLPAVAGRGPRSYWPRYVATRCRRAGRTGGRARRQARETLIGLFGLARRRLATRDPFRLRRCRLGVVRILDRARNSLCRSPTPSRQLTPRSTPSPPMPAVAEREGFILDRCAAPRSRGHCETGRGADRAATAAPPHCPGGSAAGAGVRTLPGAAAPRRQQAQSSTSYPGNPVPSRACGPQGAPGATAPSTTSPSVPDARPARRRSFATRGDYARRRAEGAVDPKPARTATTT